MTNEPADASGYTSIQVRVPTRCAAAMRALLSAIAIPDGMTDRDAFALAFSSTVGVHLDGPCVCVTSAACLQPHCDPHKPPHVTKIDVAHHIVSDLQALGAAAGAAYVKANQAIGDACGAGAPEDVKRFLWNAFYQSAHRVMHSSSVVFGACLADAMEQMPVSNCAKLFGGGMEGPDVG